MEHSNGGDMGPLVGKESAKILVEDVKTHLPEIEEGVKGCIQSVDGKPFINNFHPLEVGEHYKTPSNFPRVLESSEESGFRHHHYGLSKKISELCGRITELEETVKVLRAMSRDDIFNFHKRMVKEITRQHERVKQETRKLNGLKKDYSFLGGMN